VNTRYQLARRATALLVLLIVASGCGPAGTPAPSAPSSPGVPLPPADEASARLKAPDGFAVRIYASKLARPRLMTIGPDGQLYVAERGANNIVRLPDANGDGLADSAEVVANELHKPHSAEWHDGALYVSEFDRASKLIDKNKNGVFTDPDERETITDIPSDGIHTTPTLHFGPDGKLYIAVGSSCNACIEDDPRRGAILRLNPDGSIPADNPYAGDPDQRRQAIWAEGLRNVIDFVFMPDGQLWADQNGVDNLGVTPEEVSEHPPEEVIIVIEKGKHYGWPFCYTPTRDVTPAGTHEVRDTINNIPFTGQISSCDQAAPARFTDLPHQAPLGMAVYDKAAFPDEYRGNVFIAYHGSWNSPNSQRDCKVQMIGVQNNQPVSAKTFLTGFRESEAQLCAEGWGRPADVAAGANGELFVSDDKNGNIYRVVYVGQ
jgi:glucose/arabinose dehydrogenase